MKIYREAGATQPETLRTHCEVALTEVAVLERCASCPHIITLLDVCKCGQRICLIFEVWGTSLFELILGTLVSALAAMPVTTCARCYSKVFKPCAFSMQLMLFIQISKVPMCW